MVNLILHIIILILINISNNEEFIYDIGILAIVLFSVLRKAKDFWGAILI